MAAYIDHVDTLEMDEVNGTVVKLIREIHVHGLVNTDYRVLTSALLEAGVPDYQSRVVGVGFEQLVVVQRIVKITKDPSIAIVKVVYEHFMDRQNQYINTAGAVRGFIFGGTRANLHEGTSNFYEDNNYWNIKGRPTINNAGAGYKVGDELCFYHYPGQILYLKLKVTRIVTTPGSEGGPVADFDVLFQDNVPVHSNGVVVAFPHDDVPVNGHETGTGLQLTIETSTEIGYGLLNDLEIQVGGGGPLKGSGYRSGDTVWLSMETAGGNPWNVITRPSIRITEVSASGAVEAWELIEGGLISSFSQPAGDVLFQFATTGVGEGLTFANPVPDSLFTRVKDYTLIYDGGSRYFVGDTFFASGGTLESATLLLPPAFFPGGATRAKFRVAEVDSNGAVTDLVILQHGEYEVEPSNTPGAVTPLTLRSTGRPNGTGFTIDFEVDHKIQITVQHTFPADDATHPNETIVQGGEIKFQQVQSNFRFSGIIDTATPWFIEGSLLGHINSVRWKGKDPYTWLCTEVHYEALVPFVRYKFNFEFQHNPDTWLPIAVFIDERTKNPPPGLVEDVGWKKIHKQPEANFDSIFQAYFEGWQGT